jgi:7-carboxy-7-deazaguanine synthase
VIAEVERHPARLVEITGGEPLEQEAVYPLMALLERGHTVMLETGGHVRIDRVPKAVIKIVDVKCRTAARADVSERIWHRRSRRTSLSS